MLSYRDRQDRNAQEKDRRFHAGLPTGAGGRGWGGRRGGTAGEAGRPGKRTTQNKREGTTTHTTQLSLRNVGPSDRGRREAVESLYTKFKNKENPLTVGKIRKAKGEYRVRDRPRKAQRTFWSGVEGANTLHPERGLGSADVNSQ